MQPLGLPALRRPATPRQRATNGVIKVGGEVVSTGGLIDCQDMKNVGYILSAFGNGGGSAQATLTFSKPRELIDISVTYKKNNNDDLISYTKGEGGTGDAALKVDGKTYTISGRGANGPSEKGDGLHEFFVQITCP
jgi:hypothetical protein